MKDARLTDGTVTLRRYRKEDAAELHAAVTESLAELKPWLPFAHDGYSLKETKDWLKSQPKAWKNGTEFNFAIVDAHDGTMLGGCGLNNIDKENRLANLGYWVRTSRSGRGVCPAATRLLAQWGFEQMKLERIEIQMAVENRKSRRVAEKVGARLEGTLRRRLVLNGQPHDSTLFSLIPGEV
jgi:ribosomal-protein-serine acetyltransferase